MARPAARACVALLLVVALTIVSRAAYAQDDGKESYGDRLSTCASLSESKRRQTDRCKTQEERDEDAQAKRRKAEEESERPSHSSFLRKFHLDGMWIPTTMGANQYGVVGTHLDVASAGRLHFFGPPGLMLITEKTGNSWHVKPVLTWGISVLIKEVRLPGATRDSQLFFNFAKSWSAGGFQSGRDLAGLSLAWKK